MKAASRSHAGTSRPKILRSRFQRAPEIAALAMRGGETGILVSLGIPTSLPVNGWLLFHYSAL